MMRVPDRKRVGAHAGAATLLLAALAGCSSSPGRGATHPDAAPAERDAGGGGLHGQGGAPLAGSDGQGLGGASAGGSAGTGSTGVITSGSGGLGGTDAIGAAGGAESGA